MLERVDPPAARPDSQTGGGNKRFKKTHVRAALRLPSLSPADEWCRAQVRRIAAPVVTELSVARSKADNDAEDGEVRRARCGFVGAGFGA